jgi:hypothetical protein
LLRRRVDLIGDHELRAVRPEEHLASLKAISERIMSLHAGLKPGLSARLNHFLTQCSFAKALDWLESGAERR